MRIHRYAPVAMMAACVLGGAESAHAQCEPDDGVAFVCGPVSPEDLFAIPDSPWVIVSSMVDGGNLYLTDTRSHRSTVLFSAGTGRSRHDALRYRACPGPLTAAFRPHGINLRARGSGIHTLYVVGHGAREAVEVFEIDARGDTPTATWVGCADAPEGVGLNSVAALPDDAFVATNFQRPEGEAWEWHPTNGWTEVPGSRTNGPNGIEASADGDWLFIGGWGTQSLIRVSRGRTPVEVEAAAVGFHIDNVRFAPDGSLLAAGHVGATPEAIFACLGQGNCEGVGSRVARVDPRTLAVDPLVSYPSNAHIILGTVALEVGDEIWMGGIAGSDRIARFPVD